MPTPPLSQVIAKAGGSIGYRQMISRYFLLINSELKFDDNLTTALSMFVQINIFVCTIRGMELEDLFQPLNISRVRMYHVRTL